MQIAVSIRRRVIIYDNVHSFDINTTSEYIGSNKNTFVKGFEGGVSVDPAVGIHIPFDINENCDGPFLLLQTGVNADAGEVARHK